MFSTDTSAVLYHCRSQILKIVVNCYIMWKSRIWAWTAQETLTKWAMEAPLLLVTKVMTITSLIRSACRERIKWNHSIMCTGSITPVSPADSFLRLYACFCVTFEKSEKFWMKRFVYYTNIFVKFKVVKFMIMLTLIRGVRRERIKWNHLIMSIGNVTPVSPANSILWLYACSCVTFPKSYKFSVCVRVCV